MINKELKDYIEKNILPKYSNNDNGHGISHIMYVINRSIKFANTLSNIDNNMVYVIAAYHDIGHSIDAKKHEEISAKMLFNDNNLRKYFNEEEIMIMCEAVEEHRASLEYEPHSIYGKIVSSADRNTSVDVILKRTYQYRVKHNKNYNLKQIINESYNHILEKFGIDGYAVDKMYFDDIEYKEFLNNIRYLLKNRDEFIKKYMEVNNL